MSMAGKKISKQGDGTVQDPTILQIVEPDRRWV